MRARDLVETGRWPRTILLVLALWLLFLGSSRAQETDSLRVDSENRPTSVVLAALDSVKVAADTLRIEESHPQDSPEARGFLIVTSDQKSSLRLRGSIRVNGGYDFNGLQNQDTFSTYDIPTGDANKLEPRFFMSATQTRIGLEANRDLENNYVYMRIEADFRGVPDRLRLRHAFGQIDHFLIGQTWSTFSHVEVLPRTVDLDGPNSAVAERSTQLRISHAGRQGMRWALSLESPQPEITSVDSAAPDPVFQNIPDIAARTRWVSKRLELQLAGILRSIAVRDTSDTVDYLLGGGALLSGRVEVAEASHFLFQGVYGRGIARFMSSLQGRGLDVIFDPMQQEFKLVTSMGGYLSFGHEWNRGWASYLTIGSIKVLNKDFQPDSAFNYSYYLSVNLFRDITVGTQAGLEYSYGSRVDKDGASGTANRIAFIYYYDF